MTGEFDDEAKVAAALAMLMAGVCWGALVAPLVG